MFLILAFGLDHRVTISNQKPQKPKSQGLLGDMINQEPEGVVLNIDNKSAISLCKNPVHHDRSKHIDTKYHYIRECVEEKRIDVKYVCTDDQLADILTKSLGKLKFLEMRDRIGVQAVR